MLIIQRPEVEAADPEGNVQTFAYHPSYDPDGTRLRA